MLHSYKLLTFIYMSYFLTVVNLSQNSHRALLLFSTSVQLQNSDIFFLGSTVQKVLSKFALTYMSRGLKYASHCTLVKKIVSKGAFGALYFLFLYTSPISHLLWCGVDHFWSLVARVYTYITSYTYRKAKIIGLTLLQQDHMETQMGSTTGLSLLPGSKLTTPWHMSNTYSLIGEFELQSERRQAQIASALMRIQTPALSVVSWAH